MAEETLDDLMVGIKLSVDEREAKRAQSSITSFRRQTAMSLRPLAGAFAAAGVANFTKDIINAKDNAMMLSKQLKIDASELYRMEKVSARFGTSFSGALLGLQEKFAGLGMEDISSLLESGAKFGIDIQPLLDKSADPKALYDEIEKQWTDLNIEQRAKLSGTLGLDQGIVNMLNNQERVSRYFEQTADISKQELLEAQKAKEAMDKLGITMSNVQSAIADDLTPIVQKISDFLSGIDTDILVNAIYALVAALGIKKVAGMVAGKKATKANAAAVASKKQGATAKRFEKERSQTQRKNEALTKSKRMERESQEKADKYRAAGKEDMAAKQDTKTRERAKTNKRLEREYSNLKKQQTSTFKELKGPRAPGKAPGLGKKALKIIPGLGNAILAYEVISALEPRNLEPGEIKSPSGLFDSAEIKNYINKNKEENIDISAMQAMNPETITENNSQTEQYYQAKNQPTSEVANYNTYHIKTNGEIDFKKAIEQVQKDQLTQVENER